MRKQREIHELNRSNDVVKRTRVIFLEMSESALVMKRVAFYPKISLTVRYSGLVPSSLKIFSCACKPSDMSMFSFFLRASLLQDEKVFRPKISETLTIYT